MASAVKFSAEIANKTFALGSISPFTRDSLLTTLSSAIDAGFMSSSSKTHSTSAIATRRLRPLQLESFDGKVASPAIEIGNVLSRLHMLTVLQHCPGEPAVTTSARSLALRSDTAACSFGACPKIHVDSPALLMDDTTSVASSSFVLDGASLAEISNTAITRSQCKGQTAGLSLGLMAVTWRGNPHQSTDGDDFDDFDRFVQLIGNVTSLTLTACGKEIEVANLSTPIAVTLPLPSVLMQAGPEYDDDIGMTSKTSNAPYEFCARVGNVALILCQATGELRNVTCAVEDAPWNVSWCNRAVQQIAECRFYDTLRHAWSSQGCRVNTTSSASSMPMVRCECDHLTDFSAGIGQQIFEGYYIVTVLGGADEEALLRSWAVCMEHMIR